MTLVDLSHEIYDHMPRIAILPEVEVSCLFSIAEGKPLNIAQLTSPPMPAATSTRRTMLSRKARPSTSSRSTRSSAVAR